MVKIVVADIDNTLVARHEEMSKETKEAINKLHENGIFFGIASGRPYCQGKGIIDSFNAHIDFVISSNGCELIDFNDGSYNTYYLMKPEWIRETFKIMEPFDANALMVLDDGTQIVQKYDKEVEESAKYVGLPIKVADSIEEFCVENFKIMYRLDPSKMNDCEKAVDKNKSLDFIGFKTQPEMMEFSNRNVSKAFALKEYCKKKCIDLKDVWAFGDTSNDNEMLIVSGNGICMKNGSDDTKAIADSITEKTCKENGFADYLNNHLFSKI